MAIERKPVTSSNVLSLGYDPVGQVLEIEFKDGSVYQYANVPQFIYDQLIASSSIGSFIHNNIKAKYSFIRLE